MTLENQNFGSEYGIEKRLPGMGWVPITTPGSGYETYEEVYQKTLDYAKTRSAVGHTYTIEFRVVVYDYDGSKRKNIRILTIINEKSGGCRHCQTICSKAKKNFTCKYFIPIQIEDK